MRAAPHGVRDFYLPHAPRPDPTLCDKEGALYWRHKGPERKPPEAHTEITEYFPAEKQELFRLLSGAQRFYSADPDTILLEEALACGCECFVWREQSQRYEPYEPSKLPVWRSEGSDLERVRAFLAQL